jgi:hypothetical protein
MSDDAKKAAADLAARQLPQITVKEARDRWLAIVEAARSGASRDEIAQAIMRSGLSNEQMQWFLDNNNSEGFVIYHE